MLLKAKGLKPFKPLVGNYVTVQEMAGFSLSMCKANEETRHFWSAKAITPYFKVFES